VAEDIFDYESVEADMKKNKISTSDLIFGNFLLRLGFVKMEKRG